MLKVKELVSIIMPIYNVEKYLRKSVEAALNQTYANTEVILVNDGSTDGSIDICREFEKKDSRVRVLDLENGGAAYARNKGMEAARGSYLYFFDSDDNIEENLIEKSMDEYERTNADLVVFNFKRINEAGDVWVCDEFPKGEYLTENPGDKMKFLCNYFLRYKCGYEPWNRVFKADIIRKNNLVYRPNKEVFAEDMCFNFQYLLNCKKISIIEDRLYYYLIRENSIMSSERNIIHQNQYINMSKLLENYIGEREDLKEIHKNYPILYMLLMYNQLEGADSEKLNEALEKIEDKEYHKRQMKGLRRRPLKMIKYMGIKRAGKYWLLTFKYHSR